MSDDNSMKISGPGGEAVESGGGEYTWQSVIHALNEANRLGLEGKRLYQMVMTVETVNAPINIDGSWRRESRCRRCDGDWRP